MFAKDKHIVAADLDNMTRTKNNIKIVLPRDNVVIYEINQGWLRTVLNLDIRVFCVFAIKQNVNKKFRKPNFLKRWPLWFPDTLLVSRPDVQTGWGRWMFFIYLFILLGRRKSGYKSSGRNFKQWVPSLRSQAR
jgi:hypothetical protein